MPNHTRIHDFNGSFSLTFNCGDLPADEAVVASAHEPNGYFWEGLIQFLAPALSQQVEFDSEAGMVSIAGDRTVLEQVEMLIGPYLDDGARVAAAIHDAEAAGFQFDD